MAKSLRERMLGAVNAESAGFFDEDYGKIRDWIDTGCILLNAQISADPYKGIPSGRIVQFAGPESVGKSFICFESVKAAQKEGYFIVYYDSEMATDKDAVVKRGLNPEMLLYVPVATVEELTTSMLGILDEADPTDKIMIVVDSLGNLSTKKELGDASEGSDKRDMTRAQKLRALFRTCTVKAGVKNIPIAGVNHVYASIGSFFGGNTVGGGGGSLYASSTILEFSKAQDKKGQEVIGGIITSKAIKNRFAKEKTKIKFNINFEKGLQRYAGLLEFCEAMEMLIADKRSYRWNPTGKIPAECQGRAGDAKKAYDAWLDGLEKFGPADVADDNADFWEARLKESLAEKLTYVFSYQSPAELVDFDGVQESDSE